MWEISKTFHCDYAHRVYVQELTEEFCACGDTKTKCRRMHGHTGSVSIFVEGTLDKRSMIVDFKELGFIGDFIDTHIDHRCVIDRNDPGFKQITSGEILYSKDGPYKINNEEVCFDKPANFVFFSDTGSVVLPLVPVMMEGIISGYNIDLSDTKSLSETEVDILESWFIVDFVPTSERLCRFIHRVAQEKLSKLGVKVSKVSWKETPKSQATYKSK